MAVPHRISGVPLAPKGLTVSSEEETLEACPDRISGDPLAPEGLRELSEDQTLEACPGRISGETTGAGGLDFHSPIHVPPSLDHVKEVAAIVVQGFRDACGDLNAEFAKTTDLHRNLSKTIRHYEHALPLVALEWELENGPATDDERVVALKGSISRQVTLLARAQAALDLRTEDYFCSSLDAASQSAAGPSSAATAAGSAPSQPAQQHHHQ
ncbi:hypothetical protein PRIPAC_80666 [Pristionchus pacificus]|uniref:Uncharacterized protein n=1 Tax=Pristionchus pacificus TaxID=54126 RepID=A0A2A6BX88_PRIPA|nr:hypothetical protein PRIPAC_80666 [Pristionchus pacificus]|eukprot:PDM70612.1 hypothetical protein PRIPAC_46858 [Pristionchus pacificus]